jgi:DNA-binding ferritin-like protein (Dps family)
MKHRTDYYAHKWASRQDWREYERRKRALPKDLSPREYEEAVRKLSREMGI